MTREEEFQTVTMTVGKLDASLALLTTDEHHIIEFPTILLPKDIDTGSVIEFKVRHDRKKEEENDTEFYDLQNEIFETYGKNEPEAPVLSTLNTTQTSCVLQWDPLKLGSTQLKSLSLWKYVPHVGTGSSADLDASSINSSIDQGNVGAMEKITIIPNPITTHDFKISGLGVDSKYKFQLRMDTSNGEYVSNVLTVQTHTMQDMSGITCCLGALDYEKFKITKKDIEACLSEMGAKLPLQTQVSIDTTHFITNELENENEENDTELAKAKRFNIPIIKPEWVRACQLEKKIIGVKGFYYKNLVNDDMSKNFKFDPDYTKSYLNAENRLSMNSVEIKPLKESLEAHDDKLSNNTESSGNLNTAINPSVEPIFSKTDDPEPTEQSIQEEVEQAVEEPTPETVQDQVEVLNQDSNPEPVQEPIENEIEEPMKETVEEQVEKPAEHQVAEPAEEETEEPINEIVEEPTEQQVEEHVEEQVEEPSKHEVAKPFAESTEEFVKDPVIEQVELQTQGSHNSQPSEDSESEDNTESKDNSSVSNEKTQKPKNKKTKNKKKKNKK